MMALTIVIPTYWTSSQWRIQHEAPDAIYDHPTPLESRSNLPRLLSSLKASDLPADSVSIVVIAAITHQRLEEEAERRVEELIKEHKSDLNITCFSASTLNKLASMKTRLADFLSLYGYSNIRNLGLVIAQIKSSDIVVFLDDDVIVKDQTFFQKITQDIRGCHLGGITGFYTDRVGGYLLDTQPKDWWKVFWPKEEKMNEAFHIIDTNRRLVETTFALGGNMALHWKMFERVPFDPYITRGEDMDLLLNAKMFGFEFLLDTHLKVVHLPGEEKVYWSEMRQDLYRFLYMREKMLSQKYVKNIHRISVDALNPYPGPFLKSGTLLRFSVSSSLHFIHSLLTGEIRSAKESLRNFRHISKALHSAKGSSLNYFAFQKRWSNIIPAIRGDKELKNTLG